VAARDIELSVYSSWGDAVRIAVIVVRLFAVFSGAPASSVVATLFGRMAELAKV
jgi:hypothetical protein